MLLQTNISHIFPGKFIEVSQVVQKIWRLSLSILIIFSIFINFLVLFFWQFLVTKKPMMSVVFLLSLYFKLTPSEKTSQKNTGYIRVKFKHSHKKRKDSLETRTLFSWILILNWNFGGDWSNSASTFFKIASQSWFWC